MDWKSKLASRKFWISVAAMLASFAASIAGLVNAQDWLTGLGILFGIISAGIYAFCEAWVDAANAKSNFTVTETKTNITSNTGDDATATVVEKVLGGGADVNA